MSAKKTLKNSNKNYILLFFEISSFDNVLDI